MEGPKCFFFFLIHDYDQLSAFFTGDLPYLSQNEFLKLSKLQNTLFFQKIKKGLSLAKCLKLLCLATIAFYISKLGHGPLAVPTLKKQFLFLKIEYFDLILFYPHS